MESIEKEFENLQRHEINVPLVSSVDRLITFLQDTKTRISNGLSEKLVK
jgi:hypothetical protein